MRELWKQTLPVVKRIVNSYVKSPFVCNTGIFDKEDLVQEAMIIFYTYHKEYYENDDQYKHFVCRCLVNKIKNLIRDFKIEYSGIATFSKKSYKNETIREINQRPENYDLEEIRKVMSQYLCEQSMRVLDMLCDGCNDTLIQKELKINSRLFYKIVENIQRVMRTLLVTP